MVLVQITNLLFPPLKQLCVDVIRLLFCVQRREGWWTQAQF